jgi:hypothetical protein
MSRDFDRVCAEDGRSSVPPERLVRSLVLQMLYSIRSERLLMEQLDHNLLFRWFVGLSIDELRHARVHGRPAESRSRGRSRGRRTAGEGDGAPLREPGVLLDQSRGFPRVSRSARAARRAARCAQSRAAETRRSAGYRLAERHHVACSPRSTSCAGIG